MENASRSGSHLIYTESLPILVQIRHVLSEAKKLQNRWQTLVKPHFLSLLWILLQLSGILQPAMLHLS